MNDGSKISPIRGRGASENPLNRFERIAVEADPEHENDGRVETLFLRDASRSVITSNKSPDIGFEISLNPYRGCEHGCPYCYARPTHEYLGFSPGLDFESRIMVKENAPELLRQELMAPRYEPRRLTMSAVTDPYQPAEKKLRVTRRCLEVLHEFRHPVAIITKNYLVTRDIDLLGDLATHQAASVSISLPTLDGDLARRLEPRASHPRRRLEAMRRLADAGVPVGVFVAPVIPALTDHEIPNVIEAAAEAGATHCAYTLLRLPGAVADLMQTWLEQHFPDRREKILHRIRDLRGGKLNEARFHLRMHGQGPFAEQIRSLMRLACQKTGLRQDRWPDLSIQAFRRPGDQLGLF